MLDKKEPRFRCSRDIANQGGRTTMRTARIKPIDTNIHGPAGTYYHISNQIAGNSRRWTFGDPEKAQFLERLNELSRFYVIQPLFCSIQGNHYHLVVFVPAQAPAAVMSL